MPNHLLGLIVVLHLLAFSGEVSAETITHSVAVKKINQTLAGQFPFSKSFQGTRVIFSEPKTVINALDHTLKLQRASHSLLLPLAPRMKLTIMLDKFAIERNQIP